MGDTHSNANLWLLTFPSQNNFFFIYYFLFLISQGKLVNGEPRGVYIIITRDEIYENVRPLYDFYLFYFYKNIIFINYII